MSRRSCGSRTAGTENDGTSTLLKTLFSALMILAMGYLALCGYAWLTQRRAMYFPQFTRVDPAETDFQFESDGLVMRGWVVNPGRDDALIYFGGNAERVEHNREEFRGWFPERSVYLVPYRGYGPNDGRPTEEHLFADALNLFDSVRDRHPEGSIAAMGRSLGSGVAAYLASQRAVEKLVLIAPFDSMVEVARAHYPWLPAGWLTRDRYESVCYLSDYTKPVLVIRAGRDEIIPARSTDRLIAALPTPPEVVELPDAGHNTIGPAGVYAEALVAFLC